MSENQPKVNGKTDPTANVHFALEAAIERLDDLDTAERVRINGELKLREYYERLLDASESKYIDAKFVVIDDKFNAVDIKYQIQFSAAEKAIAIAQMAQEKLVASALEGTKEAINKAEVATDKRFELLGEKINGVNDTINKTAGLQVVYVTHSDLSNEMDKLRASFESMLRPVVNFMNSQVGKSSVEDPIVTELLHEVKKMRESNATTKGTGQGMDKLWGWIAAVAAILFAVLTYAK